MKIKKSCFIFSNDLPLQIWTLNICNCDISKTIIARSFKFGELIKDDKQITWLKFIKKNIFFSEFSPFADLDFEN